jgi:hypothetical protein
MFWVIQNNIYREHNHEILIKTLERMGVPYTEVKIAPFVNKIIPATFDFNSYKGSIEYVEEAYVNNNEPVMVCGGTLLAKLAKDRGWHPGSFLNDNFDYTKWVLKYSSNVLNNEAVIDTFESIKPLWSEFFIRPCEDSKDFNGSIFNKEEFEKWRSDWLIREDSCPFKNNKVMASPIKKIYSEYRFFIVDGKVVTYSQYKMNDKVVLNSSVDDYVVNFAQDMVDTWQPARAFVIDVALTPDGLKVIEINNINSAGFYACDVSKFINAIEDMSFNK